MSLPILSPFQPLVTSEVDCFLLGRIALSSKRVDFSYRGKVMEVCVHVCFLLSSSDPYPVIKIGCYGKDRSSAD